MQPGGIVARLRYQAGPVLPVYEISRELHPYAWDAFGYAGDDLRALLARHNRVMIDIASGNEVSEYRYGAVRLVKRY